MVTLLGLWQTGLVASVKVLKRNPTLAHFYKILVTINCFQFPKERRNLKAQVRLKNLIPKGTGPLTLLWQMFTHG